MLLKSVDKLLMNFLMELVSSTLSRTTYLKYDGNDIIANVSLLGKMKAIVWVVGKHCGNMERQLMIESFRLILNSGTTSCKFPNGGGGPQMGVLGQFKVKSYNNCWPGIINVVS